MKKREKVNSILKEVLKNIEPSKEDLEIIETSLKKFTDEIQEKIKKEKIEAEVFVGGSFAKGTLIKKGEYDIDIFIRFDKKYKNISELTQKILERKKDISVIHGSRDYFRLKIKENIFFEIVPTMKVKNPKDAENITDLSYFHVKYVKNKLKSKETLNDVKIAKVFCYANNFYGAESYIGGFSGYGLELLIYYFGSFLKFVKNFENKKDKQIIDIEKNYKNKNEILMNLNSSKLQSPVILIDPTYKQRNVLAALRIETFEKFKKSCSDFLKNPSNEFFVLKKIDFEKAKNLAKKKNFEFILIKAETERQEGDIAGSKLLKFHKHLNEEISKFFKVADKGFEYSEKKSANYFFVAENKKEMTIKGPFEKDIHNAEKFRKKHKNVFVKSGNLCAVEKIDFNLKEFIESWMQKNKKKTEGMGITNLKIVDYS